MQLTTTSLTTNAVGPAIIYPSSYNGLMIVGDCPYNEHETTPFSNSTYGTLAGLCKHAGLRVEECIQAALTSRYPENGVFQDGDASGCHAASTAILQRARETQTRVMLFVGRQVLGYFKRDCAGVDDERGAPFYVADGIIGLATLHPKELYREWHMYNIVVSDFKKVAKYLANGWAPKTYDIQYQPSYSDCVNFLQMLLARKPWVAMDIETSIDSPSGTEYVTCIGFGLSSSRAFVIPFQDKHNGHYFALHEEIHIWRLLAQVLETGRFVGHNALHFDHWFLAYWCGILCNVVDDTMFAHWEVYTELEKSLGFCNSIYCDNPYWKDILKLSRSGKVARIEEFRYNGLDNCQTLEVATAVGAEFKELPAAVKEHYKFNVNLSRVFQYMSLRGCFINRPLLRDRVASLDAEGARMEAELHALASKRINVRSPKQMKEWLYKELRLPVKTKMHKNEDGSVEDRESADFLSLAYLAREYPDLPALMAAARLRKHQTRLSKLRKLVDETGPNGECYWNFNAVGTETGRASGYKPYNGLGVQPQNPDKRDRDLFIPVRDDLYDKNGLQWLKCDLEGADAWTVAAQMVTLGDNTMFEDLKVGLKPALVLALAYTFGEHLISADRATLAALSKDKKPYFKTPEGKQKYDTTKAVSHGCLTADAEVLTPSGWVKIADYRDEEIMTVDESRNSFYAKPLRYVNYPYTGNMVHFSGSTIDMLVTADHTVPYLASSGKMLKTSAATAFTIKANRLPMSTYKVGATTYSDLWLQLAAAYHCDGSKSVGRIKFHFQKHRKVVRLTGILNALSEPFDYLVHQDGTASLTISASTSDFLRKEFSTQPTYELTKLSQHELRVYVEECLYWDGCSYDNSPTAGAFYSAKQEVVEVLHTLCYLCGKGSTFQQNKTSGFGSTIHHITINNRLDASMGSLARTCYPVAELPVYCFTTCTGMFLVRRNGKVFITGNTNYMMQEPTMHVTIFRKSQAELYVPINECKKLKALYMRRYPGLARLHAHIPTMLNADGYMDCPSGMRRVFFGRADNHRTRVALALLPQNNTALATNRALYNLYYRDYNRTGSGARMFLSPINQVHDECDFVFDLQHLDRAREVFNRATDFISNCWGVEFKIPFDANYGKHWGGADQEF